jgi:hypothetical protein
MPSRRIQIVRFHILSGLIALVFMNTARSQYQAAVSPEHLWSSVEIHCMPGYNLFSSRYFAFKGDTTIGNIQYQQLFMSQDKEMTDWYLWGFYREDANERKIWYRPVFPEAEGLVYDFSANEGDTVMVLNHDISDQPVELIVQSVTTEFAGGIARKKMTLWEASSFQAETWIEGIGSLYGFKNSGATFLGAACGSEELLCFSENGEMIHQNPAYYTCFFELAGTGEPEPPTRTKAWPVPSSDLVNIEFGVQGKNTALLFSSQGRIIRSQTNASEKFLISLGGLPSGMYHLHIIHPQAAENIRLQKL